MLAAIPAIGSLTIKSVESVPENYLAVDFDLFASFRLSQSPQLRFPDRQLECIRNRSQWESKTFETRGTSDKQFPSDGQLPDCVRYCEFICATFNFPFSSALSIAEPRESNWDSVHYESFPDLVCPRRCFE
jgi:hypothetical protein